MPEQLRLPLAGPPPKLNLNGLEGLAATLRAQPWPGGAYALLAKPGDPAFAIAEAWAHAAGAGAIERGCTAIGARAAFEAHQGKVWVADADRGAEADPMLTHLIDLARARLSAQVLFIAPAPPSAWATATPDLRSRLAALPVLPPQPAAIEALAQMLRAAARQLFLELPPEVADYVAHRIEPSEAAVAAAIAALEKHHSRLSQPIGFDSAEAAVRALHQAEAA